MIIGLLAGVFWALDTILIGCAVEGVPYLLSSPVLMGFIHDAIAAAWVFAYMFIKGKVASTARALRTKSGKVVVLAAILGGPVGMSCYVAAISQIGPGYTAVISATFPAVGSLLAWLVFKEKMSRYQIIGTIMCVCGIMVMGYLPYVNAESNTTLLGLLCAVACCLCWALEAVICSWGMRNDVDNEQALLIREISSAVMYSVVVITFGEFITLYQHSAEIVSLGSWLAGASLFGMISYFCYYRTIQNKGTCTGMALDVTYSAWAVIFATILLGIPITLTDGILCSVIIAGSILASIK